MPDEHQRRQRVVDHRLVVDRHELLADGARQRMQPRARAAGEDDSLQHCRSQTAIADWHRRLEPEPLAVVAARLDVLAPVAVLEVPAHGRAQAVLERVARRPAELAADLRRVDRVAAIVAGPIGHERLELAIARRRRAPGSTPPGAAPRARRRCDRRSRGSCARCRRRCCTSRPARPCSSTSRMPGAVILDVQPVADVAAVAVDRQRPPVERVQDHQRDQLLGKLKRPVVVRAVRDQRPAGRRCGSTRARGDRPPPCSPRTASSARTASPR